MNDELGAWAFRQTLHAGKFHRLNLQLKPAISINGIIEAFDTKPHANVVVEAVC
jgi:hypothetical protein